MIKAQHYLVKQHIKKNTHIDNDTYLAMYQHSLSDPEGFWGEHGKVVDWIKPFTQVKNTSFDTGHVDIRWFEDGTLNVSANCIDRHLAERGDEVAIIWEGDDPADDKTLTFNELHKEVCKFSNALKEQGVHKGDVVCLYMPMVPEAAIAMLACTRIGAVHTVVFGGFSPEALSGRIIDSDAKIVITADEGVRGGRAVPLKKNVDEALTNPEVKTIDKVVVLKRTGSDIDWHEHRDVWWHEATAVVSDVCPPEEMKAEDPLFILYTSGSTGKPKGVLHTTGGYLVYATMTFKYVFDYQEGETFWCTADVGWITGHTYLIYGPLAN
ncbi:AMP-binding protein, partial [Vibrio campbellii]